MSDRLGVDAMRGFCVERGNLLMTARYRLDIEPIKNVLQIIGSNSGLIDVATLRRIGLSDGNCSIHLT